jgi:hypothetical protein
VCLGRLNLNLGFRAWLRLGGVPIGAFANKTSCSILSTVLTCSILWGGSEKRGHQYLSPDKHDRRKYLMFSAVKKINHV